MNLKKRTNQEYIPANSSRELSYGIGSGIFNSSCKCNETAPLAGATSVICCWIWRMSWVMSGMGMGAASAVLLLLLPFDVEEEVRNDRRHIGQESC
jgi:hypothetical protein